MVNNTSASWLRLAKLSALGFAAVLLTGCVLAPGSHMERDSTENSSESLEGQVKTYAITPTLLADLRQPRPQPELNTDLEQQRADYDYIVGNGDVLNITVWNHPELTIPAGSMRNPEDAGNWVHNDGTIFYPYVGKVKVAGKRVTEIRELLTERLSNYIEEPQVDVSVAAFRSKRVYVTGEVNKPGTLPVTNIPLTLLDAVNTAGGISEEADWTNVVVTRNNQDYRYNLRDLYQSGDTQQNVLLQPGDVVHVARNDASRVFVMGEVRRPASVNVSRNGMSLAEALSEAGGIAEQTADAKGIFVLRQSEAGSDHLIDVYQLNAKSATAFVLADQFALRERDIVYVTAAPVSRWNRVISQLLPSVSGLYQVSRTDTELNR
ncbi:polysaccharide export protein [Aliidiomarina sp. Khilg15.8]